ncbi:uncharacterized protein METZ01_LOCUS351216 [marine metagenome]|uniref:Uncharacterized protein n=1 Tax=marine metagenome TaxID=408172 RepID=A0A382RM90_9ZZZZ
MKFIFILIVIVVAFIMGHIYGDVAVDLSKNLPTISIKMPSDNSVN